MSDRAKRARLWKQEARLTRSDDMLWQNRTEALARDVLALVAELDAAREELYGVKMTCPVCDQYGDGCLCGGVNALHDRGVAAEKRISNARMFIEDAIYCLSEGWRKNPRLDTAVRRLHRALAALAAAGSAEEILGACSSLEARRRWAGWLRAGLPWTGEFEDAVEQGEVDVS